MNVIFRILYINLFVLVCFKYANSRDISSIDQQSVLTEYLPTLYDLYKHVFETDKTISTRRFIKNNSEYTLHVQKLKEVNGLKTHNLKIEKKNVLRQSPIVYINNPIESKIPNAYLTVDEFKAAIAKLKENQNKNNLRERLRKIVFTTKRKKTGATQLNDNKALKTKNNGLFFNKSVPKVKVIQIKNQTKVKQSHKHINNHNSFIVNKDVGPTSVDYTEIMSTTDEIVTEIDYNKKIIPNVVVVTEEDVETIDTVAPKRISTTVAKPTRTTITKQGRPFVFMGSNFGPDVDS